ncbi:MAG: GNAT family N-acetyltransferase [Neisseriaceae bacterium]|nr:MAG: GNAT family N-acetyltransferase [Neisseriaceae bacterium]
MRKKIKSFAANFNIAKRELIFNGRFSNTFPCIETKRLTLRRLTYADAPALFEYFSQDVVTEYYDLAPFQSLSEAEDLIRTWNTAYDIQSAIRWGIVLKENNQVIGTCGYHNFREKHGRAELGYELNLDYWQQGYMTEAIIAIQKYGFKKLRLHRIEAFIFPDNLASRKLLEKVGLQSEGILRDYFFEKGRFIDGEIFSILIHEWKKKSNSIYYSLKNKAFHSK